MERKQKYFGARTQHMWSAAAANVDCNSKRVAAWLSGHAVPGTNLFPVLGGGARAGGMKTLAEGGSEGPS